MNANRSWLITVGSEDAVHPFGRQFPRARLFIDFPVEALAVNP
jgi:hypothetical protein